MFVRLSQNDRHFICCFFSEASLGPRCGECIMKNNFIVLLDVIHGDLAFKTQTLEVCHFLVIDHLSSFLQC